jgi:hypothetical protein
VEGEGTTIIIVVLPRFGASMPDTACHRHATLLLTIAVEALEY